ncbi:MAG: hypothetical protein CL661_11720 [Bacteroidetes bacterium]|nr:hypothetical protein [Bacteroidota bacterium]
MNRLKFFEGFKWGVHLSFRDCVQQCYFEGGDTIHNSKLGYQPFWEDSVKHITYTICIKKPRRGTLVTISKSDNLDGTNSIFKKNWDSEVVLELIDVKKDSEKKFITTTQGRLFTLLYKDDLSVLDLNTPNPTIPISIEDASKKEILADNSCRIHNFNHLLSNEIVDRVHNLLEIKYSKIFDKRNYFVMLFDKSNNIFIFKDKAIKMNLDAYDLKYRSTEIELDEIELSNRFEFNPSITFKCYVIEESKIEFVRDLFKKSLYPITTKPTKTLSEHLERNRIVASQQFKLTNHGKFIPYKIIQHNKDIRVHSFKHAWFYRYRVALSKIKEIPSKSLTNYIESMFEECPNHIFEKSKFHASSSKHEIDVDITHLKQHDLIDLTNKSESYKKFKEAHENLEGYLLENDKKTICCELPLWLQRNESRSFVDYKDIFSTSESLTGHIDVLRFESGKYFGWDKQSIKSDKDFRIGVWDFKPRARNEKFAHVQVFLYSLMLSLRTGISLNYFICGYFDNEDLFYFSPNKVKFDI